LSLLSSLTWLTSPRSTDPPPGSTVFGGFSVKPEISLALDSNICYRCYKEDPKLFCALFEPFECKHKERPAGNPQAHFNVILR